MELSGKSNINPQLWGPYFWQTFHFTAFGYPEEPNEMDKDVYSKFFENFMKILPCDKCSVSSQELYSETELQDALESRDKLIRWSYDFHDKVNKKLDKKSPTFEKFLYNFQNRNKDKNIYKYLWFLVLLLIIGLIMHYTSNNP